MGLDMYIYKVRKCDDFDLANFHIRVSKCTGEDAELIQQIMPYLTQVEHLTDLYDFDKIAADYGLDRETIYLYMLSSEDETETGFIDHNGKRAIIKNEDIDAKYTVQKILPYYICTMEEIAYWGKAYDLQDAIHKACDEVIENCGYYRVTSAMRRAILNRKAGKDGLKVPVNEFTGKNVFYHEWY